jgi:hypothetical protein
MTKLVYEVSGAAVKPHDVVESTKLGQVIVHNVHAPRKKHGIGRVQLELSDGRLLEYTPDYIHAKWV